MSKLYDVIILGAGPAGLSAGLYAGRYKLSTLIIEKSQDGGQISITDEIENYPGQVIDTDESGSSLVARMTAQAAKFGCERASANIVSVELEGEVKKLTDANGNVYEGRTVIIASGAHPRPIGCKNESDYVGKGISFCATCDANFFEDLEVYVVGGGDSAVEEAIYLTKFARKVTIIHRRDALRAAKSIQEKAFANDKIEFMWDSIVEEVSGDEILTKMLVKNVKNIVGVKEAGGDISVTAKIFRLCRDTVIDVYSGNDDQNVAIMALGGKGAISVLSNIAPKKTSIMCHEVIDGNIKEAARLQLEALDVINNLFIEVNPIPVKAAMNLLGKEVGKLRLPLTYMEKEHLSILEESMKEYGLL